MPDLFRALSFTALMMFSGVASAQAQVCDVDADGDIDRVDIGLIFAARNTPAQPGDPRDADGDGVITILDGRRCMLMCTLPGCAEPAANTPPVANAGNDQTVELGELVTLDGSGSSDADGDALTFFWSIVSAPAGSAATLSDATAVGPTFTADTEGEYLIELTVNDGTANSAPDEVIVITVPGNTPPVADAGPDQSVQLGDTAQLDGSGSTDVDGDALTYFWTMADRPAGSSTSLSDATVVNPTFVADVPGVYVIELVVDDGNATSFPDSVTVSTSNTMPVADAGPDQSVALGGLVTLDGGGSIDADGDPLSFAWSLITRPTGSSAVLANANTQNPTFVADVAGTYIAQLIVNDATVDSDPDTVLITTTNSQPVADAGNNQTANVGDTVQLDGSGSSDADNDPLTFAWSFTSRPATSIANLVNPTSAFPSFVADVDGMYVVQLIVNDGSIDSDPDTTTVTIQIVANEPPVAADDAATTDEDTPVLIDVLANDSDDIGPIDIDGFQQAANGIVSLVAGQLNYAPNLNFNGVDSFTYTITDGIDTDSATVVVTVNAINDDPVANDDNAGTDEETPVSVDVLANDTDVDGDSLTISGVTPGANGGVTTDGSTVTYTPDLNFTGDDTFTYTIDDGNGGSDTATVTVAVGGTNDNPVANDDAATTDEDVDATIDVLANDTDGDGDTLTISAVTQAANGAVTNNGTNVTYSPDANFNGTDTFTYTADDGNGGSDTATVTVTVNAVNDDPVANDDGATTAEDIAVVVDVLANDVDDDGDALTVSAVSQGTSGTVVNNGGNVTYTPAADFNGVDSFTYTATDGTANSTATVTVTVTPVNDAPVANDDTAVTPEDTSVGIAVLANDTDIDGDSLTVSGLTQGANGGTVINNGGLLTYTPPLNFAGTDTFTYSITDGLLSDSATVVVTITPLNDIPVANAGAPQTVTLGQLVTLDGSGSSDADNDTLTFAWQINQAPAGSVAALNDATVVGPTFTPDLAGAYVLQLIVNDGTVNSAPSTVTITVNAAAPSVITMTPAAANIDTRDTLTLIITLDQPALPGGQLVDLVASNTTVTVPATVTVPQGATQTSFQADSDLALGGVTVTASAAGLTGDSSNIVVQNRLFGLVTPLVGIDRTVTATIILDRPAPAGGATLELSVANTGLATVSPATLTIPQGQIEADFELTGGLSIGATTVTADGTADGYESQTIDITVTDRLIDLPIPLELGFNDSTDLITLIAPDPAPAGGTLITAFSDSPGVVQVLTPTALIPEGEFATVIAVQASNNQPGVAIITASNPAFAPDTMAITVSSALDIVENDIQLEGSEPQNISILLQSGGRRFPAPAGGVTVNFTSSDSNCVIAPAPIVVAEGEVFGAAPVVFGGNAALPCTAVVTADGGIFGTDTVDVTVDNTPDIGSLSVQDASGFGGRVGSALQSAYRILLSNANHGGVVVRVRSDDFRVALVAPDPLFPGTPATDIFVPDGQTSSPLFYVQGVQGSVGTVNISVTEVSFTSGSLPVTVEAPVLRIDNLTAATTATANDDAFWVRTGLRNGNNVFGFQGVSPASAPLPISISSSDPTVGLIANSLQAAQTLIVPLASNQQLTPTSVANGGVAFDALAGGNTIVAANAPGFDATFAGSTVAVSVAAPGMTIVDTNGFQGRVGSGLQTPYRVDLEGGDHGGVTVTVTSSDPGLLLLAPNENTAGSGSVTLNFVDGDASETFYVQGVSAQTGAVTLTATEGGGVFATDTFTTTVEAPILRIDNLTTTTTATANDDAFWIRTGLRNGDVAFGFQGASAAAAPLTITVASSNPAVGQIVTLAQSAGSLTIDLAANQQLTPTSVNGGGVAFDALSGGTTVVSATAVGFDATFPLSAIAVDVDAPEMTIRDQNGFQSRVGSGLQTPYRVDLEGGDHGGVSVTVTSSDPGVLLLAPDALTAGSNTVTLNFVDGDSSETFYVQGVNAQTGAVTLTATESGGVFATDTFITTVESPILRIDNLTTSTTATASDDAFWIRTGLRNGNVAFGFQGVSAAAAPLTITVASSDPAVGQIANLTQAAASLTIDLAANQQLTPTSVNNGGVAFDALAGGTTVITATANGFDGTFPLSAVSVDVAAPGMTIIDQNGFQARVGSGLQTPYRVALDGGDHGGVSVTVTSSDPAVVLLAPDANTAGGNSVTLNFADGDASETFYVQGVASQTGAVTLTATETGGVFAPDTFSSTVEAPIFRIDSVTTTTTAATIDDPFWVRTGLRNGTAAFGFQGVSAAAAPLTITIASSDPAVGQIANLTQAAASLTIDLAANQQLTPTSVNNGGVAFDALTVGTTTITATAAGFDATFPGASVDVTVNQAQIDVVDSGGFQLRIGSGLQQMYRVNLSGPDHGGVTIRVASSAPGVALIAPDTTTAGTSFIDIAFADGDSSEDFYIQGVAMTTGSAPITGSQVGASTFASDTETVTIETPILRIDSLNNTTTAGAADDPFWVRTGLRNGNSAFGFQGVSAGNAPLTISITNSNEAAGQLVTSTQTGGTVTLDLAANQQLTPTSVNAGGVAYDPIATGVSIINATAPGFDTTFPGATDVVTVNP